MKMFKIILILIVGFTIGLNFDVIVEDIKNDFHKDYCIEMYKGRGDLINECIMNNEP